MDLGKLRGCLEVFLENMTCVRFLLWESTMRENSEEAELRERANDRSFRCRIAFNFEVDMIRTKT